MMIIIPKRITELEDELKCIITAEVWKFACERGVMLSFLHDSMDLHDSINTIASRTVYLIENTKLDTLLLEGVKKMQKAMDNAEKGKSNR